MLKLTDEPIIDEVEERIPAYVEVIKGLKKKLSQMTTIVSYIEHSIRIGDKKAIHEQIVQLASDSANLTDKVKRLISATGNDVQNIMYEANAVCKCQIERVGEGYRIVFDRLLPHTLKRDTKTTDSAGVYNGYLVELYRELSSVQPDRFNKPVAILFINHFSSEYTICDPDNLETAAFVDAISSRLLIDDSPKWCSRHFEYTMDDKDYSEIVIIPADSFVDYYIEFKKNKRSL